MAGMKAFEVEGRRITGTVEGGRLGICDCATGACKTLQWCWGHELPREFWREVA